MREGFTGTQCPRCGGNVFVENDYYGWRESCLQCGYARDIPELLSSGLVKGTPGQYEKTIPRRLIRRWNRRGFWQSAAMGGLYGKEEERVK